MRSRIHPIMALLCAALCLFPPIALSAENQAPDFDVTLTAGGEEPMVSWHGYYEFEYLDSEDKRATFDAHKITVWMGVRLGEGASLSSEVEYEHAPAIAGGSGSGQIKVDSAQLRLAPDGPGAASFGVFYVPFGIEYLSYPGHLNKLVTRPKAFKGGGVIPGTWSDIGVGLALKAASVAVVDLYVINGDPRNGRVALDSAEKGNEAKTIGGRIMLSGLADGLNIGASYAEGKWDPASRLSSSRFGAHLRLDTGGPGGLAWAPGLIAEYVSGVDEAASAAEGKDKKVSGYYVQASCGPSPRLELAVRHGAYNPDGAITGGGRTESSVGLAWLYSRSVRFKMEYQLNGEEGKKIANDLLALQVTANW